jgi:hypothetical protein
MLTALQRPNLLILGQTLGRRRAKEAKPCGTWRIWHAIWHGARKTGCDRSDSAGQAHPTFQGLSVPVVVLWRDRRDPLGRRHPPTDQKVGGSNPSERAKVLVTGLLIHVCFFAWPNLAHKLARTWRILTRPEARFRSVHLVNSPTAQQERHSSRSIGHGREVPTSLAPGPAREWPTRMLQLLQPERHLMRMSGPDTTEWSRVELSTARRILTSGQAGRSAWCSGGWPPRRNGPGRRIRASNAKELSLSRKTSVFGSPTSPAAGERRPAVASATPRCR